MSTAQEGRYPLGLLVGNALRFTEGAITLTSDEDGVRFHVAFADEDLGSRAELEIVEGPGGARGHLRMQDATAPLFDEVQLVQRNIPTSDGEYQLVGLQGEFSFPHEGPFRRLRRAFVGVQDPAMVNALVAAFASDEHDQVTQLPFTLESMTRFTAAYARSLPGVDEVTVTAPGQLTLRMGEGAAQHVDLHNIYASTHGDAGAAMARIQDFLAAMPPSTDAVDDGDVMFRVMRAPSPVTLEASVEGETQTLHLASLGVGDDLSAVFVRDSPQSMAYLQASDVEDLAASPDDLFRLAGENLLRSLPKIHIRGEAPLFMLIAGGDYECSLALLPSFWQAMTPLL
ncbi:MAG: hypothetical protein KC731_37045, partial [Myxococcales bacterium]|nr:hypothetical protein [Myxococcales bacterium]